MSATTEPTVKAQESKKNFMWLISKTNGTDYQGKVWVGAFLDELKARYPEIFERVQISNGQKDDNGREDY